MTSPFTAEIKATIPAQSTADTEQDTIIGEAPFGGVLASASLTPEAAVTGNNTNSRTFTIVNKGASGAGTTVMATLALPTGTNLVAYDEFPFTLSATAADLVVAEGDVIVCNETTPGTGVAHGGGVVSVKFSRTTD